MKNLVILGAGTAGTMLANKMLRLLDESQWRISIVDQDNVHVYQPGLLFYPFGSYKERDILRPRTHYLQRKLNYIQSSIDRVAPDEKRVFLKSHEPVSYDMLVIATGTQIAPELTEGLMQFGWQKNIFDFYTFQGAKNLAGFLEKFEKGRLVLNVVDMPIKCPVAPLEFLFLADEFFTKKGCRDQVEIVYATPLDGAFTKPVSSALLSDLLARKNIKIETNFNTEKVDGEKQVLRSFDGRDLDYDGLVTIPLHTGSPVVSQSHLGDEMGFVPTHKHTLQTLAYPNIFALGDATNLPASKAGAVAHFQADVLVENLLRYMEDKPLKPLFDGHSNCFIETGFGKAMLIDFNYETEPLQGHFPLPAVGPMSLLKESEVNHWGKLAFKWIYWNMLLKGDDLPIHSQMQMAGKWRNL